ncbi:hypothetical protein KKF11_02855 [Patescibacteria group bacterium]|nr:hypothetical protein [Patescibacteria group bacterium]
MKQSKKHFKSFDSLEKSKRETAEITEGRNINALKPEISKNVFSQESLRIKREGESLRREDDLKVKQEISTVREELGKLIKSISLLQKETQKTVAQEIVDPGIYHQNFLQLLKQTIIFLRARVEESTNWLSALNKRSKKQGHYWAQAKKSGTKYTLSGERSSATQTL